MAAPTPLPPPRRRASPPRPPPASGNLVIWADPNRVKALTPFADQFGTENGVTVEVKEISKDNQQTFLTASQQGSGPDVMVGAHDWIGNLVQNGAIEPVNLTEEQKAAFSDIAIKAVTFDGQIYGAPYAVENIALIRNTDLAPDAPATIEDMVATGKKLKDDGKVQEILCLPVAQKGDAFHVYPLFAASGGKLFGSTPAERPRPQAGAGRLRGLGQGLREAARAGGEGRRRAQDVDHQRELHPQLR
ncbi:extracellular solute-binding protein [Nonomuraea ferruginea]